ncbi:aspartate aminotransferase family protein [Rhodohalobacter sp. SW132]|uniref:aspartate aminotransferase family protein n=1 Tax=Rhodohalobacter sp. SW132 TaxID=2293433 RepID=UPI000E267896|nr:aspartate aminotransferase family protein [Rhodohalobacter sp. SW132]REL39016.1 aspartate aminotransferase family protein [Rhodohalobacter sp. SW132]
MKFFKSKSEKLLERRKAIVANGVGVFNTATVKSAKGATIIDSDGKEWIDFAGGIGVVNAGHCPKSVVKAIQDQAAKYIHTSFNVVTYEPYIELCEKLAEILPHGEETKAMLVSTGAEAVENAIKIARQATKRQAVVCYTGAFHGRTMMAMTLTSKIDYKLNCGPFAPEVYRLPFPNYYRYNQRGDLDQFVEWELKRLHESMRNMVDPANVAAIIMEPIQGEGGINPAPEKYLKGLRKFCDDHGILLIFDEVQSGFGRTGNWASWQNYRVTPDISTYAKSLGSGMPIAAILGKADVMDAAAPGTIGGTYIGNPVCCAAALATIAYMEEIDLNKKGIKVGIYTRNRLKKLQEKCPQIGDVRGLGAFLAVEFVKNGDPRQPDGELTGKIVKACAERGLVLLSAGTHKNVLRILSPLVISDEQLDQGLSILEEETLKACGIEL